jgi:purine-binding chemotaxis protein CheW
MDEMSGQRTTCPALLATFYVDGAPYGIDIMNVQEINKQVEVTPVPKAPDDVSGILNLRGTIITVIDLGTKLGTPPVQRTGECRNIIVNSQGERVGLLVDEIADVVTVRPEEIEPPPANLSGGAGEFVEGVVKADGELISILDVEALLREQA